MPPESNESEIGEEPPGPEEPALPDQPLDDAVPPAEAAGMLRFDLDEAGDVAAPSGGLTEPREHASAKARVRRGLAWALVLILATLVLTGCIGWLFMDRSQDDFQAFAVIFAPVTTLVGTVLAFYFSSDDN